MPSQSFKIEDLKKWQDDILEHAKKKLREDDGLRSVAFVLTEKMNIEEGVMHYLKTVVPEDKTIYEASPSDTVLIILDMILSPEQTLSVIQENMTLEQAAFVTLLEQQGRMFGAMDPAAVVAKVLMERLHLDEKDVQVMAIELVIKKTDAIAYIKLDETWMVQATKDEQAEVEKYTGLLEEHPRAIEAIISLLETDDYVRMVSIPFRRNRPKTGRIVGFDKPNEIEESATTPTEQKLTGRLPHLFKKAKSSPKAPAHPDAN